MYFRSIAFAALAGTATSTILWDGRFNDYSSSEDIADWSWSNEVGEYQYYIHGDSNITSYVNLDSSYKNPADSGSTQGVKITLDSTAYWEGQTMRRTELIPQTDAAIDSGKVWYHFSMMKNDTNAPSTYREHQIAFFESHFTEMKSGVSTTGASSDNNLRWEVSSTSQWNTTWESGVWHNIAYEIDFDASTVAFYHSTGADDLTLTVSAVSCTASSNGADWHLGVLEQPVTGQTDGTEDIYFSGVYVESGSLTTSVAGPDSAAASGSAAASVASSTTAQAASSSAAAVVAASSSSSAVVVSSISSVSEASVASSSSLISVEAASVTIPTTSGGVQVSSTSSSAVASSSTSTKKPCSSVTPTSSATSTKKPCSSVTPTSLSTSTKKPCSSVYPSSSAASAAQAVTTEVAAEAATSTATATDALVVSTVWVTDTFTVTACPASITNCPVGSLTSSVRMSTTKVAVTTTSAAVAVAAVEVTSSSTKKPCSSVTPTSSASASTTKKPCSSVYPSTLSTVTTKKPCSSVLPTQAAVEAVVVASATSYNSTSSGSGTIAQYYQCGGTNFSGSGSCVSGTTCTYMNDFYSQCI